MLEKKKTGLLVAGLMVMAAMLLTACADEPAKTEEKEVADALTGSSVPVDAATQLPQEEIRAMALDYLRGFKLKDGPDGEPVWSYREMYQIATSYNNMPGLSSVEFVLNPETMRLYAASEKGTEKVLHIPENPNVVMYWYKQIPEEEYVIQKNDYFNSYGVQVVGTARLMSPEDENFYEAAARYLETLYGPARWGKMPEEVQKQTIDKISTVNEWIEITPKEFNVTSLWWVFNKEGSRRPRFYDPDSPYFGLDPRQVYYPEQ